MKARDVVAEAKPHFDFLIDEGFVPMGDESRVAFSSADFGIEVLYDEREGYVTTLIDAFVGDRNPRASLSCLYVEAGLGPAQDVRETARTKHSLDVALGSQAAALRKLLPVLLEPGASDLLLRCPGR